MKAQSLISYLKDDSQPQNFGTSPLSKTAIMLLKIWHFEVLYVMVMLVMGLFHYWVLQTEESEVQWEATSWFLGTAPYWGDPPVPRSLQVH